MRITQISVNNPVFATMMMVGLVVMGLFAYQRLSVDQMPDVTFPFVQVQTSYVGASSEAVMQDVTRPIEEAVNTISGIKSIRSFSREGFSRVMVEFDLNIDVKTAVQDVRDKVAGVRRGFNKDVGEPTVTRADNDNDQPIMYMSMKSPARSLKLLAPLRNISSVHTNLFPKYAGHSFIRPVLVLHLELLCCLCLLWLFQSYPTSLRKADKRCRFIQRLLLKRVILS